MKVLFALFFILLISLGIYHVQKTQNPSVVFSLLQTDGSVLPGSTIYVEKADTQERRILGLSGRAEMSKHTGLLFVFDESDRHGIWMKDMLFPIDIYWFDKDFTLIDMRQGVDPSTYPDVFYPMSDAQYVLETTQGQIQGVSLTKILTGQLTESHTYDKK